MPRISTIFVLFSDMMVTRCLILICLLFPDIMVTKYVILMWMAVGKISSTPKGAPEDACSTLTPVHGDAKPQSLSSTPYKVKVHKTDSKNRKKYILTLTLR